MSKIDWTKPIRVKNTHEPVRVICTDRKTLSGYKFVVLVCVSDDNEIMCIYAENGAGYYPIENIPEEKVEYSVYYPKGLEGSPGHRFGYVHDNLFKTDKQALKLTSVDGKLTKVEILD